MHQQNLEQLVGILDSWDIKEETSVSRARRLCSGQFTQAVELAEELVYGIQDGVNFLRIQVGRNALQGYELPKGVVDIHKKHEIKLEPNSILVVDKAKRLIAPNESYHDLYFGGLDSSVLLSIGEVATNLRDGGQILVSTT